VLVTLPFERGDEVHPRQASGAGGNVSLRYGEVQVITGLFVGLSTIDLVYGIDAFPAPDTKITALSQSVFVGGPATNAAITFRHLGGEAHLASGAGHHPLSALIRDELHRFSIPHIELTPNFSDIPPISSVCVNRAGERNVVSANATRMRDICDFIDQPLCDRVSVLLIDGHFMEACQRRAAAVRTRGGQVVLDAGSWKEGTAELLTHVNTVIASADFRPPHCSSHDEVVHYLRSRGIEQIAISRAADPILVSCEDRLTAIPVPSVPLVDTMGAGDILHGGFCYYSATGLSFCDALERASQIASESCRYPGTREWMKHITGTS